MKRQDLKDKVLEGKKKAAKNKINIKCNLEKILKDRNIKYTDLTAECGIWWQTLKTYTQGANVSLENIIRITNAVNKIQPKNFGIVKPSDIWPNLKY